MTIQPGLYRIKNRKSGTYLDASTKDQGSIHGWSSRPDNDNQKWHVEAFFQAFKLKNAKFNQYACIRGMEDGNKLVLTDDQNVMNEWDIQDKGNGNYSITSRKTQQAIDLDGGHAKDGTSVSVYGFHGGEQQEWQFQRA